MSRSCPACDQVHGKGEGGFLHESRDYPSLLHCNYCGRYYECKKDHRGWADSTTLRRLSPEEVAQHREVRG